MEVSTHGGFSLKSDGKFTKSFWDSRAAEFVSVEEGWFWICSALRNCAAVSLCSVCITRVRQQVSCSFLRLTRNGLDTLARRGFWSPDGIIAVSFKCSKYIQPIFQGLSEFPVSLRRASFRRNCQWPRCAWLRNRSSKMTWCFLAKGGPTSGLPILLHDFETKTPFESKRPRRPRTTFGRFLLC